MWKQQKTSNLIQRLTLTFVIIAVLWDTALGLSDKRLCADEKCKTLISTGRGMVNYPAGQEGMVSFKPNANIRVMSKSAGSDPSLWGIEVNGRVGYAPKILIKEEKIHVPDKSLKYVVDVVKPGEKVATQTPTLNASETFIETTTTQPLDINNKNEAIVNSPVEKINHEQPQTATPVQQENVVNSQVEINSHEQPQTATAVQQENIINSPIEITSNEQPQTATPGQPETIVVEGTKLPAMQDSVSQNEKVNQQNVSETSSIEYDDDEDDDGIGDYDDDEEEEIEEDADEQKEENDKDAKNQQNVSDSSPEEAANKKVTPSSLNSNNNVTNLLETLNNNVDTIANVTTSQNSLEHPIAEATKINSTENFHQNTLLSNNVQDANIVAPIENEMVLNDTIQRVKDDTTTTLYNNAQDANIVAPLENEKVLNESSTTTETAATIQTVAASYPDLTNNSLKEETETTEKVENAEITVESATNVDSMIQTSSENPNNADKLHPSVTKETEEAKSEKRIPFPNTNKEALPTATVQENIVEKHISDQSSLPDNKTNGDFATHAPPTAKSVDLDGNSEVKSQDVTANKQESSNEQTESPSTEMPHETTTQFVEDKDKVHVNTNQYTPTNTDPNSIQTSTESVPTQQTVDPDTQFKKETPTETQNKPSESLASENLQSDIQTPTDTHTPSPKPDHSHENTNVYYTGAQYNPYDYDETSNTPLPPQYDNNNNHNDLPHTTDTPHYNNYEQQPSAYAPADLELEVTTPNPVDVSTVDDSYVHQQSYGQGSVEPVLPLDRTTEAYEQQEDPKTLPSLTPHASVVESDKKENKGLFATIMDTVNNILPNGKKPKHGVYDAVEPHSELDRILYTDMNAAQAKSEDDKLFCEKLDTNNCPHSSQNTAHNSDKCECSLKTLITTEFTFETFAQALASKVLEISELIAFLAIVASACLFFIFGYYCFCNSSSEGALLSKLNQLESSLLASHKENAILKHNLMSTRQKLASIEDNSFGSNDMVVSLKKELEEELLEKARLQEQIVTLQKELENAADAGIELNKIVSELLSNQTGDESIISSVEELQKQLNEQQNTILEINASLAEKSRENSELQLMIAEQNARYETQISDLQQDNDELEGEKGNLQSRLEEIKTDFDKDITAALEGKNFEIKRLQNEIVELSDKVEAGHTKWQTSMAKVEALEECLKNVKRDPNVNITQVIDVANVRAELLDAQKKFNGIKERWELEQDARKLAENQLKSATAEVEKIKQDFNQTEKDKLEAQTRLEVLSNYFKEKENQLQKELSLKETMWLKQQGETTTTVDRLTTMQEEIQSLKSQNDSLRAEIEAQVAAHKAQTGTLENRAHETWLAARQSDRRYEEARAEATALRRKLTMLAGGNVNEVNKTTAGPPGLGDDLANAPSPIHMESPGSPMLGRMPPPPFLPPPFMGPPPPFMGMPPPPPFVPPGEMRPAPLGRIMSPPPPQRSGHIDYEDYLDYEGNSSWHRHHTYSPPPRTYRSLSPTDSRYNYGNERDLISTYDTETDFSPPPSPRESRRRGGGGYGSDKEDDKSRHPYNNSKKSSSANKAPISSGSDKSYNSTSNKKGNKSKGGGKFLV